MINIADNPAVRAQIEQELARQEQEKVQPTPECVRAPEGPGHEAAIRQQGGAR